MKLVITGGHMAPALAVIDALPKDIKIFYIGRKYAFEGDSGVSLEYLMMSKRNIPFIALTTGRVQRSFSLYTLQSFGKIPYGVLQAIKTLWKIKPDVVVGFGGYVSVPVGLAAYFLRIPLIIHEQTQEAGIANSFLGKFARIICISFPSSAKYFSKERTILTGNPILLEKPSNDVNTLFPSGTLPLLCIVGGSAGSHIMNLFVEKHLAALLANYRIVHQTGDAHVFHDYEHLCKIREKLSPEKRARYTLVKFILPEDIRTVFKGADVVLSRAGINTITLLMFLHKQSILIPLLTGQKNEQKKNAQFLKDNGLAEVITDMSLSDETLLMIIKRRINKKGFSHLIKKSVLLHEQAASRIVQLIYDTVARKTKT